MTGLKITADFIEKELQVEDTNDYSGLTPPAGATQIGINFRLISPAGITTHNNTSTTALDLYPDALATFEMNLLTDSSQQVVQGGYQLRRSRFWCDANGEVVEAIDVVDYAVTLGFQTPVAGLNVTIDYFIPLLKSVDTTNYVVNGATPTITRDNRIVHSNALDPELPDTVSTGPVVQTSTFGGAVGGLEYVFKLHSELEYIYPAAIAHTNVSGTSPTLESSANQALYVYTEVSFQKKQDIDNPQDICKVFCALKSLYERYIAAKCSNATQLNNALTPFLAASAIAQLMRQAYFCGKTDLVIEYRDVIVKLAGATDDCGCCGDDGPTIIQGLGVSGNNTVVIGTNGQITVSYDGSDTYQVGLADQVLDLINALTFNVTSDDNSISVETETENGVTTFDLSLGSLVTTDRLDIIVRTFMTGGALPSVQVWRQKLTGTLFQEVTQDAPNTFMALYDDLDLNDHLNSPVRFLLENFIVDEVPGLFASAEIVSFKEVVNAYPITADLTFLDNTRAILRFRHMNGDLVTGSWIAQNITSNIDVKITFTA